MIEEGREGHLERSTSVSLVDADSQLIAQVLHRAVLPHALHTHVQEPAQRLQAGRVAAVWSKSQDAHLVMRMTAPDRNENLARHSFSSELAV